MVLGIKLLWRVGDGTTVNRIIPVQVSGLTGLHLFQMVVITVLPPKVMGQYGHGAVTIMGK
jgi:hypothetical protein